MQSFRQQIQLAFEQGKLKFETPKRTMKIDQHLFATNMVDMDKEKSLPQAKIPMSSSAKKSGVVDPKAQITADEVKGKNLQEEAECSSAPCRRVTSQMLLNKFQRDRERQQCREEEARRGKEHWRCPFFVYCWEEGLTLPSANDCPECNGQGSGSYKKPHNDYESHRRERIPIHDRLRKRVSVHDRLGGRTMLRDPARRRIPAHDWLEQMADDRVQDDQPMHRVLEREPCIDRTSQPQWCPVGLTRSQKRRVQRLHQLEVIEEEHKQTLSKKRSQGTGLASQGQSRW